jgi:hypothetical protein
MNRYYAHWAGCRMLDALAFGPDHAVHYIRSLELWLRERWTDPVSADGGTVVDLDCCRMRTFDPTGPTSSPG